MLEIERIGKTRKQLGLTQKRLASMAGVSQSLIAKIESGRIDPAYSKVMQILSALDTEQKKGKKTAGQIMTAHVLSVAPSDSLERTVKLMREKDISQLPVFDSGKSVGSISDTRIVALISERGQIKSLTVAEVMLESFPVIPADSFVDVVAELLRHYRAVLVGKSGKIAGIITKADLLKAV